MVDYNPDGTTDDGSTTTSSDSDGITQRIKDALTGLWAILTGVGEALDPVASLAVLAANLGILLDARRRAA